MSEFQKTNQYIKQAQEASRYFDICRDKYPETMRAIVDMSHYTNAQKYSAIAECAYIMEYGSLPEWAWMIEKFERRADGGYIFIHKNLTAAQ